MNQDETQDERKGWTSASNAEADLLCPGRHIAQKGLPQPPPSPDADKGTRIHDALARKDWSKLNDDEREIAERCDSAETMMVAEWLLGGPAGVPVEEHREERLWAAFGDYMHSGKGDVLRILGARALILDYKTGRGTVAPNNSNQQLRDLAVLAFTTYDVDEVTVKIIQPLAPDAPPCVYTYPELFRSYSELRSRVRASNNPQSPRIPGETQCQYCLSKGTARCPEFSAAILPAPLTITELPTQETVALAIQSLPSDKLGQCLALLRMGEACAEQEVRNRLAAGQPVAGWHMGKPEARETITDAQTVWARCAAKLVTVEEFMAAVKITKTGLKTALRGTGVKGNALDAAVKEVCDGCTETKMTKPSLERE